MLPTPLVLSAVVPVYNESECLPELIRRLDAVRDQLAAQARLEVIFVDDGSRDDSVEQIVAAAETRPHLKLVKLSRNFGHQLAVTAGLDFAFGDYVCIIDADLQDPPELIGAMLEMARRDRLSVVYAQRRTRPGETWFKRATAALFYRMLHWMCRVEIPANTGDFRLIDRRVADHLLSMRESSRFIRGMVPLIGMRNAPFLYDRDVRYAGVTKYPFRRMARLATDAILSFSVMPLRFASWLGLCLVGISFVGLIAQVAVRLTTDTIVPGITVLLGVNVLIGGMIIFILGVLGEYVGRIFEETKRRPLYFIELTHNLEATADEAARAGSRRPVA